MILISIAALALLAFRDYSILGIGPTRKVLRRLGVYAVALWAPAMCVLIFGNTPLVRFFRFLESPRVLASVLAVYAAASLVCIWLKRSGGHGRAWLATILPAPAVWIAVAWIALAPNDAMSDLTKVRGIWVVTLAWIAVIAVSVLRLRGREVQVDDLDFAIDVAAWSNWISLGLIAATMPLAS
jgi:hypothetical protein